MNDIRIYNQSSGLILPIEYKAVSHIGLTSASSYKLQRVHTNTSRVLPILFVANTQTHKHINTHTHTHTHIYIYIYVCVCVFHYIPDITSSLSNLIT